MNVGTLSCLINETLPAGSDSFAVVRLFDGATPAVALGCFTVRFYPPAHPRTTTPQRLKPSFQDRACINIGGRSPRRTCFGTCHVNCLVKHSSGPHCANPCRTLRRAALTAQGYRVSDSYTALKFALVQGVVRYASTHPENHIPGSRVVMHTPTALLLQRNSRAEGERGM
jgi:hypothetical protein